MDLWRKWLHKKPPAMPLLMSKEVEVLLSLSLYHRGYFAMEVLKGHLVLSKQDLSGRSLFLPITATQQRALSGTGDWWRWLMWKCDGTQKIKTIKCSQPTAHLHQIRCFVTCRMPVATPGCLTVTCSLHVPPSQGPLSGLLAQICPTVTDHLLCHS